MSHTWQNKALREAFEIAELIKYYEKHYGNHFEIIKKVERPDYLVRDNKTQQLYGIELTSVYLSDRSVFEEHMHPISQIILEDPDVIENYKKRILHAVAEKIQKARSGYDISHPLLLSVYVNESIGEYLGFVEWKKFEMDHQDVFKNMAPFAEIIFWPLPQDRAYFIRQNTG
jgi:hypothetical protein